jgi:hypothetical protein
LLFPCDKELKFLAIERGVVACSNFAFHQSQHHPFHTSSIEGSSNLLKKSFSVGAAVTGVSGVAGLCHGKIGMFF